MTFILSIVILLKTVGNGLKDKNINFSDAERHKSAETAEIEEFPHDLER
jgi:hypothetical protein